MYFGLLFFLAGLTSGCNRTSLPPRDTVVVALSAPPSTLDPRFATDATGSRIAGLLFSSLTRIGPELKPVPEAAKDWTHQGLVYTFHVRDDLKFSNGRDVTADDIEFSFHEAMAPQSPFASSLNTIDSVHVDFAGGKHDVVIKLRESLATFLGDLSEVKILPKAETMAAGKAFAQNPIGSGPFAFEMMNANEIRLRANPFSSYAKPKLSFADFKIIRDDNTRVQKLIKGEIDLAQQELPPSKINELESHANLKVFKYAGLSMTYLLLNLKDPVFAKLPVRKAIAGAIDRDKIIRYKLEGLAEVATSILTPSNPFFPKDLHLEPFDLEKSSRSVQDLKVGNQEFILKTNNTPSSADNGRVIAHQLIDVGLNVKVQSFEWGTFYGDVQNGRFQMALLRWVGTVDPDIYRRAFSSHEIPPVGRNRGHYENHELDALVEKGIHTEDEASRKALYDQVQKIILDDLPIIPLWYDKDVAVVSAQLHDYQPPPNGDYWPLTQVTK